MSLRVADRVDQWDQRPFDGGYSGLHALSDGGFSGVVRAGGAELYMTSGTVVGIDHGNIEDFDSSTGTVFEAPSPALPLLCVMQAADADVRAQYYTEETPISNVDSTLTDGGFTGFLELSENVLSGDYFLVYHAGHSMAVGFVGASEQLISDDEAFETANDEVGIYKVRQVDVQPIDIPEPPDTTGGETDGESSGEPEETDAEDAVKESDEPSEGSTAGDTSTNGTPETSDESDSPPTGTEGKESAREEDSGAEGGSDAESAPEERKTDETAASSAQDSGPAPSQARQQETKSRSSRQSPAGAAGGQRASRAEPQRSRTESGAVDLETRSIPSLDPDRTHLPRDERSSSAGREPSQEPMTGSAAGQQTSPSRVENRGAREQSVEQGGSADSTELTELEDELAERVAEIDRLESDLDEAETQRDEIEAELEEVRKERDELVNQVDRLESELGRLEQELGAATDAERRMTPAEAVEGTNLFVDYESKGAATLEKAHGGTESKDDVTENLQLGVHTEFEEAGVAVNGQEFDKWLRSTLYYRFAEWLIDTLLFEIRDTGHADDLVDLYDAIPKIRRVEFNGSIEVEYIEDGQEMSGQERFDVIFRHRMGDPLVVAKLNDSRDPATGGMMGTLVTSAERVGQTSDSLSSAVLVTNSFFESEALETVSEATRGGILSRDSRTSFVNLSRKQGYHLCLVAARDDNFHMEVPEL